jgi:hypothetical protein
VCEREGGGRERERERDMNGGKLHKELYDLTLYLILIVIKLRNLRWVRHVAYMGETRETNKDLDNDNDKQDV